MKDIPIEGNINFNKKKEIDVYESFSLKITDTLYKKNIKKYLEILSNHFLLNK